MNRAVKNYNTVEHRMIEEQMCHPNYHIQTGEVQSVLITNTKPTSTYRYVDRTGL